MEAMTTLIAQHSHIWLVVAPESYPAGSKPVPGSRIATAMIDLVGNVGGGSSHFRVEHLGDDSYRVASLYADLVFDVAGGLETSGAPIILWPWHGGKNQRFRLKKPPVNNKAWGFFLEAEHSGKVLDVARAGPAGAELIQWDWHGGPNQLFRIFGCPIKPLHTEFVLDVVHASHDSGALIVQFPLHGGPNQLFRLEWVSDFEVITPGPFRIVAEHSGKVLDVSGGSLENGAPVIQWDWHGGPNQLFNLERVPGGYLFRVLHSKKVLDVRGASQNQGTQLVQWDFHGGPNQIFQL